MSQETQIFLALLDEATDVWRPAVAHHKIENIYQIVTINSDPNSERAQFQVGDFVRCKLRKFVDGSEGLIAYERANWED